jgi:hypothetical protein
VAGEAGRDICLARTGCKFYIYMDSQQAQILLSVCARSQVDSGPRLPTRDLGVCLLWLTRELKVGVQSWRRGVEGHM